MALRWLYRLFKDGPDDQFCWRGNSEVGLVRLDADGRIEKYDQAVARAMAHNADKGTNTNAAVGGRLDAIFRGLGPAAGCAGKTLKATAPDGSDVIIAFGAREPSGMTVMVAPAPADNAANSNGAHNSAAHRCADRPGASPALDNRASAEMLADLSHEMRTPLNAVIGFADAMENETFGPLGHDKYVEYARHINSSGRHLLDLISSILDLSKIEAQRFSLKRQVTGLSAIAYDAAAMVRGAADAAGLSLTLRISEDLPESYLDPRAVRQILINLLANAVKFTSDGGVTLEADRDGDWLIVVVSDTGVGMSEAELARLGGRFTSALGEGVRGAKGAGLGLALAFALAEAHGGSLKLASAPGEGMCATLRLPVAKAPKRANLSSLNGAPKGTDAQAQGAAEETVRSQLDRIEAYRRELDGGRDAA
ncbi:MAG: HAMP domain-containing sensor histidine kinase [Pseudomonadota bacterium]